MRLGKMIFEVVIVALLSACGGSGGGDEPVNKVPTVNAGVDKSVQVNETLTITGSGTDSDGTIVSYEWKKGTIVLGTTATLSYIPTTVGTDTLTLTVTDDDGVTASDSVVVTVTAIPNKAPTVNAGADKSVQVNETLTIIGSGTDSDGTIISYEWKKGSTVLATTATFHYLPTVVGTDTLILTVTDDDGAIASDSVVVTVIKDVVSTLSDGLVAHYEFEGNADDSSGNGNDGTEHGGVSYIDGMIGKASSFDGVDDYIEINTNENLRVLNYSVSSWIKTNDDKGAIFSGAYDFSMNATKNNGFDFQINGGKAHTNNYTHSSGNFGVSSTENINTSVWKHIIMTWDGDVTVVYIDGIKNNVQDMDDSWFKGNIYWLSPYNNFYIGKSLLHKNINDFKEYKGELDDLRVYNRVLNESEIQELYNLKQKKL